MPIEQIELGAEASRRGEVAPSDTKVGEDTPRLLPVATVRKGRGIHVVLLIVIKDAFISLTMMWEQIETYLMRIYLYLTMI